MTNTNRADSTIGIHMSDSPTMATSMCKGIAKRSTLALREQERKPQSGEYLCDRHVGRKIVDDVRNQRRPRMRSTSLSLGSISRGGFARVAPSA